MRFFRRQAPADGTADKMHATAELFVETARKFGETAFDFSEQSVKALEEWADHLWDPTGPRPGEAELDSNAKLMGAYLGEVVIRNLGGRWIWAKGDGMAQPAVQLPNGSIAWVLNKAYKRQLDGLTNNLAAFYIGAKRVARAGPAGPDARDINRH